MKLKSIGVQTRQIDPDYTRQNIKKWIKKMFPKTILSIYDQNQPVSMGPVVVTVNFWPLETISACKTLPTSKGSGA